MTVSPTETGSHLLTSASSYTKNATVTGVSATAEALVAPTNSHASAEPRETSSESAAFVRGAIAGSVNSAMAAPGPTSSECASETLFIAKRSRATPSGSRPSSARTSGRCATRSAAKRPSKAAAYASERLQSSTRKGTSIVPVCRGGMGISSALMAIASMGRSQRIL